MGSSFGTVLKISTFGESHGGGVGAVIEGCPPRLPLSLADIQIELDRRRPGQSHLTTQRQEADQVEILSGVFEGYTTGVPIGVLVRNKDARPAAYEHLKGLYRPSHADYTYEAKYGHRNWQGSGRASARETIGRVAAGAVARKLLSAVGEVEIVAWVCQVGKITGHIDSETVTRVAVEEHATRCPDPGVRDTMATAITNARRDGDSLGGVVACVVRGVPPGLGDPVFDRFEADLAKAMLSLPAVKGFEIGSGFGGVLLRGSEHNDLFDTDPDGKIRTRTNYSGGVQGGITNGENIFFRVAFKPTATISRSQETRNRDGDSVVFAGKGRHDPCVVPRAVPMVEAMCCLVLADHFLRQRTVDLLPPL